MNNLFTHLKKQASDIRLTHTEKEAMRSALFSVPVSAAPLHSPYLRFFAPRAFAYAFSAVLIVGSGTAYAAQGSLPGNPLYPVKVNITERLETAFALTPEAKIDVNERIAERRIEEVVSLTESDTLDEETAEKLAENFDYHSSKAVNLAEEAIEKNTERTEQFAEKIHASINALDAVSAAPGHPEVATTMMTARVATTEDTLVTEPETETKKNAQKFVDHVRKHVELIREKKQLER
jgi:hypothetical protein